MKNTNDFDLDLQKVTTNGVAEDVIDTLTNLTSIPCTVGGATIKISLKNKCQSGGDMPTTGRTGGCCTRKNSKEVVQCI